MFKPIPEGINNPERLLKKATELTPQKLQKALDAALLRIDRSIDLFGGKTFPSAATGAGYLYAATDNHDWTEGFWTGMLWLAYQLTGDSKYRTVAEQNVDSFAERMDKRINVDFHDMGFLFGLSCVAAYNLTGSEKSRTYALKSADCLANRYQEKGRFIQAWGEMGVADNYRLIIDCFMNLPLLFWATKQTGNPRYAEIAKIHAETAYETVFRPDGTTYHTFFFDPKTGAKIGGVTAQGFSDDSCWARGQSWGIYGLSLYFDDSGDSSKLPLWYKITNVFLNALPSDLASYWDLLFGDGSGHPRDTSAAAITACGLLRAKKYLADSGVYDVAARAIVNSLIDNYTTAQGENSTALISDGMYNWPKSPSPEGTLFGDYFYLEALAKLIKPDIKLFW